LRYTSLALQLNYNLVWLLLFNSTRVFSAKLQHAFGFVIGIASHPASQSGGNDDASSA
jgi:hypothetical protein